MGFLAENCIFEVLTQDVLSECHPFTCGVGGYYDWGNNIESTAWGSTWRMPTKSELEALIANCTCTWDGTKKGLLCTGKGDYASNSIFLPAAGYRNCEDENLQPSKGFYCSSTRNPESANSAFFLLFDDSNPVSVGTSNTGNLYLIRTVLNENAK